MKIISLEQIKEILKSIDIIAPIENGFVAYSEGNTVVPPVGELIFKNPPGDVHVKYGYIIGDNYYVTKIASGFYENPALNLPSSNGLMLLFSQKTGELLSILLDEGYLTNLRTAAAGAIVAKYLAPSMVTGIGIVGAGTQARLQLAYLKPYIQTRDVVVYGRDKEKLFQFKNDMEAEGFNIDITQNIADVAMSCNYIVTTTPASSPVLFASHIKAGTHITAVGADSAHKQELDENIFDMADVIIADSISQCIAGGEIYHAIRNKIIDTHKLVELGDVIAGTVAGRTSADQITIADLTGLAVQDLQIAKAVYEAA